MDPDITFFFDGKNYTVSSKASDINMIILPDGRAIRATGWLESFPPKPSGLHEVRHVFHNLNPEEIATLLNGVVAQLV